MVRSIRLWGSDCALPLTHGVNHGLNGMCQLVFHFLRLGKLTWCAPVSTRTLSASTGSSTTGCTNASSLLDEPHGCEFCNLSARTHNFCESSPRFRDSCESPARTHRFCESPARTHDTLTKCTPFLLIKGSRLSPHFRTGSLARYVSIPCSHR